MAELVLYFLDDPVGVDRPAKRVLERFLDGRNKNTLRAYKKDLADFMHFRGCKCAEESLRDLLLSKPGRANEIVLEYQSHLINEKRQPTTINRRLAAIRSIVKMARIIGVCTWAIEIEGLDVHAYRDTRGPGREAVKNLMSMLSKRNDSKGVRDYAIARLLHDVALRRGEVVSLDFEHVDLERGALWVLGKGRLQRSWITMSTTAQLTLEAWMDIRGDEPGPLFISLDSRMFGNRLTGSSIYDIIKEAGEKIGIKARPHGLRHTAITSALDMTNGNLRAVQRFSRHADARTLGIYDDNRRDMAGEISELVSNLGMEEDEK